MKTKITLVAILISVLFGETVKTSGQTVPSDMVLIPAGSFQMGDTLNEGYSAEQPVRTVYVSAFYMDKFEVTEALWDEVYQWAVVHGYQFYSIGYGKASDHPVMYVSWYDSVKWCNARSEKENRIPAYYTDATQTTVYRTNDIQIQNTWVKWNSGYRLPTEAEWEKAARGGTSAQRFYWGNTITHNQANYRSSIYDSYDLEPTKGYHPTFNDGVQPYTSPVGYFTPNGYGLYDMAGNVSEWCWDWWNLGYGSSTQAIINPLGSGKFSGRITRGGNWLTYGRYCRVTDREDNYPNDHFTYNGFRTVLPSTAPDPIQFITTTTVQPVYGVCPVKGVGKDSLVVVTHGWMPKESGQIAPPDPTWVDDMVNAIRQNLTDRGLDNWQVESYKWAERAWVSWADVLNGTLLNNADKESVNLGNRLKNLGWKHIHLIAHSAGAAVIQGASLLIKEDITTTVHTTFLDAYVGATYDGRSKYGLASDWSDSYSSQDSLTGIYTEGSLDNAYNVDVTWLDPNKVKKGRYRSSWNGALEECRQTVTSHGWPREFYLQTITGSVVEANGFGFQLSKEGGNWDFTKTQYPGGNDPPRLLGTPDPSCISDITLPPPDLNPFLDLTKPLIIKSPTGTTQVIGKKVTLLTGSPVWLSATLEVTNAVNLLSFLASFSNSIGSEGMLSVYWGTNLIGSLDERVTLPGVHQYTFPLSETVTNGTRALGFRLDAFTATQSSVTITNVALGFSGVKGHFSLSFTGTNFNGLPVLQLVGPAGFNYGVESSTNLADWSTVATLVNTNGIVRFVDPESTNATKRFYRAVAP